MKIKIKKLKDLCESKLMCAGLSKSDADNVFYHLLDEELLGKPSHGFIRMPSILNTLLNFHKPSSIEVDNKSSFVKQIVAHNTLGIIAASKVAKCSIDTAVTNDFSIVSGIGYSGTTGALGYYGRMFTKQNLIGIVMCSSEYAVAPWGGKDAILGTNPIAIAIPNGNEPIIIDFATAAMTYGDLMLAAKEKREVPYGIVIDEKGKPSHDPNDANNGAQLPMAQHKGYALGLAIEILAGLFIGAKAGKEAVLASDGILMIGFKPNLFIPDNEFFTKINLLINEIQSSSLASGFTRIHVPGEGCMKKIQEGYRTNICDIPDSVYNELLNL